MHQPCTRLCLGSDSDSLIEGGLGSQDWKNETDGPDHGHEKSSVLYMDTGGKPV
jgi:hypothetical protein